MIRFKVSWHSRQVVVGQTIIHGRLKVKRYDNWPTVGVFQLTELEWVGLTECCRQLGIEVTNDAEEPAIQT